MITSGIASPTIQAVTSGATSVYDLSFSGNTLNGGTGTINIEQATAADLATVNGIPTGNVQTTCTPTFGAGAPATP